MAARSLSSSVFGSVAAGLSAGSLAPVASPALGALLRARLDGVPVPFALPASLASLPGVSFSAPVSVVSAWAVPGGVDVLCSDGVSRRCLWATVARFRGAASAAGAARFFADPAVLVGRSFRFVAVGGWKHTAPAWEKSWFAAVVAC